MAAQDNTASTYEIEDKLVFAIMQLEALISIAFTSQDFTLKHKTIKENYLMVCSEKMDTIRVSVGVLMPHLKDTLAYEPSQQKANY